MSVLLPKRLPSAPFGLWLLAYERMTGLTSGQVADVLRIQARRSHAYRYQTQSMVAFDVVDRALTNASRIVEIDGVPIFGVEDLYPELGEEAA